MHYKKIIVNLYNVKRKTSEGKDEMCTNISFFSLDIFFFRRFFLTLFNLSKIIRRIDDYIYSNDKMCALYKIIVNLNNVKRKTSKGKNEISTNISFFSLNIFFSRHFSFDII